MLPILAVPYLVGYPFELRPHAATPLAVAAASQEVPMVDVLLVLLDVVVYPGNPSCDGPDYFGDFDVYFDVVHDRLSAFRTPGPQAVIMHISARW